MIRNGLFRYGKAIPRNGGVILTLVSYPFLCHKKLWRF
jgi:hypothetical protein